MIACQDLSEHEAFCWAAVNSSRVWFQASELPPAGCGSRLRRAPGWGGLAGPDHLPQLTRAPKTMRATATYQTIAEDERRIQQSLAPRALLPGRNSKPPPAPHSGGQTGDGLHGSGAQGAIDLGPYCRLSQLLQSSRHLDALSANSPAYIRRARVTISCVQFCLWPGAGKTSGVTATCGRRLGKLFKLQRCRHPSPVLCGKRQAAGIRPTSAAGGKLFDSSARALLRCLAIDKVKCLRDSPLVV